MRELAVKNQKSLNRSGQLAGNSRGSWDLKMIAMAYIFTIIFILKLCKSFCGISYRHKLTMTFCDKISDETS